MSDVEYWIGPPAAVTHALTQADADPTCTTFLTEASLPTETIQAARWVGIAPPPLGATVFTLHAPEEGDGSASWVNYGDNRYAPECDLVITRIVS